MCSLVKLTPRTLQTRERAIPASLPIQVLAENASFIYPDSTFKYNYSFEFGGSDNNTVFYFTTLRQHTNNILVIGEFNFRHIQSFSAIQFLFVLQNIVVKEFLQFLVTIVDTELFKRIDREILYEKKIIFFGQTSSIDRM